MSDTEEIVNFTEYFDDLGPTDLNEQPGDCPARASFYYCTRNAGHAGLHQAAGLHGEPVCATWETK